MTADEMNEIFEWFSTSKPEDLSITDFTTVMTASVEFAEKIKPIMIKHKLKDSDSYTFLFKL
jgi:hypothetical protein